MDAPGYPTVHLRAILDVIVKKFHKTTVSVTTATTADGNLCTTIDGTTFRRRYKPAKPMLLFEAEAVAICRFVRPVTHVLGYSIVDANYPTLARLVYSEMNRYSEEVAELQTCVDKAVGMMHRARESIKDVHEMLTLQAPREDIEDLNDSVGELLTSIKGHCTTVDRALAAFRHYEVRTSSIYLGIGTRV